MNITTDSFFAIGKHHVASCIPCQDYAHSGMLLNGIHYAGLADGCSSSDDSDLGARALVHWMRVNLRRRLSIWPVDRLFDVSEREALVNQLITDLGLNFIKMGVPSCMDATLNFVFMHRAFETGYVLMAGDGVVAFKHKGQERARIYVLEWDESMPPYLSYLLHDQRRDEYKNYTGSRRLRGRLTATGELGGIAVKYLSPVTQVEEGFLIIPFNVNTTEIVAVFSDGIGTFHGATGINETLEAAVRNFMQFPSFAPGFVKRNYNRLMRGYRKGLIDHSDDFSMAAIRIDHDATEETASQVGAVKVEPPAFAR